MDIFGVSCFHSQQLKVVKAKGSQQAKSKWLKKKVTFNLFLCELILLKRKIGHPLLQCIHTQLVFLSLIGEAFIPKSTRNVDQQIHSNCPRKNKVHRMFL